MGEAQGLVLDFVGSFLLVLCGYGLWRAHRRWPRAAFCTGGAFSCAVFAAIARVVLEMAGPGAALPGDAVMDLTSVHLVVLGAAGSIVAGWAFGMGLRGVALARAASAERQAMGVWVLGTALYFAPTAGVLAALPVVL